MPSSVKTVNGLITILVLLIIFKKNKKTQDLKNIYEPVPKGAAEKVDI